MSDAQVPSEEKKGWWPAPPLREIRTEPCPECWQQCGWCSANRIMCRSVGCATIFPKKGKCEKGEAEKGKKCGTCDGSGRVKVRREIIHE